jgi:hypothetical protein
VSYRDQFECIVRPSSQESLRGNRRGFSPDRRSEYKSGVLPLHTPAECVECYDTCTLDISLASHTFLCFHVKSAEMITMQLQKP